MKEGSWIARSGAKNFSLRNRVHTGSGAEPDSYSMGSMGLFSRK